MHSLHNYQTLHIIGHLSSWHASLAVMVSLCECVRQLHPPFMLCVPTQTSSENAKAYFQLKKIRSFIFLTNRPWKTHVTSVFFYIVIHKIADRKAQDPEDAFWNCIGWWLWINTSVFLKMLYPWFPHGGTVDLFTVKAGHWGSALSGKHSPTKGQYIPKEHNRQVQLAAHFYSYQTKHCTFSQVTCLWRSFPLTSPMLSPEKNADGRCRNRQAKCSKIQIIAYMSFSNAWSHLKLKMYDSSCEWVNFAHNNAL